MRWVIKKWSIEILLKLDKKYYPLKVGNRYEIENLVKKHSSLCDDLCKLEPLFPFYLTEDKATEFNDIAEQINDTISKIRNFGLFEEEK